jgi:hypothetical protein
VPANRPAGVKLVGFSSDSVEIVSVGSGVRGLRASFHRLPEVCSCDQRVIGRKQEPFHAPAGPEAHVIGQIVTFCGTPRAHLSAEVRGTDVVELRSLAQRKAARWLGCRCRV